MWRDKYDSAFDELKKIKYSIDDPQKVINPPTFNLSYSNFNNLNIMKKTSDFFRTAIPVINFKTEKNNIANKNNDKIKRIRIGLISTFFTDHTIGKLYRGLIRGMDKKKFELIIFHFKNTKNGKIKDEIDNCSDKIVVLNGRIGEQQKQIENELLDVIFYPDIGMTSSTYFLAYARLAPTQIMGFGHPETSGINTIDYFLSSNLIESENSNVFYNEKLICIDRVLFNFIPPKIPQKELGRSDFSLPKDKNLYCCPQTLFKIHPDFDLALSKIVEKDDNSLIVMIETKHKFYVEKLKNRWIKNFPILNKKVMFLKNMQLEEFLSLIKISDVLLDPFYFGAGLSFAESMVIGTPTVTMPSKFMRSRVAAGMYKQMKILNPPIAKNVDEYVDLAFELAKNKKNNLKLRNALKDAAKLYLFNDINAVKKFETFLIQAHESSKSGSFLKDGHIIT